MHSQDSNPGLPDPLRPGFSPTPNYLVWQFNNTVPSLPQISAVLA